MEIVSDVKILEFFEDSSNSMETWARFYSIFVKFQTNSNLGPRNFLDEYSPFELSASIVFSRETPPESQWKNIKSWSNNGRDGNNFTTRFDLHSFKLFCKGVPVKMIRRNVRMFFTTPLSFDVGFRSRWPSSQTTKSAPGSIKALFKTLESSALNFVFCSIDWYMLNPTINTPPSLYQNLMRSNRSSYDVHLNWKTFFFFNLFWLNLPQQNPLRCHFVGSDSFLSWKFFQPHIEFLDPIQNHVDRAQYQHSIHFRLGSVCDQRMYQGDYLKRLP